MDAVYDRRGEGGAKNTSQTVPCRTPALAGPSLLVGCTLARGCTYTRPPCRIFLTTHLEPTCPRPPSVLSAAPPAGLRAFPPSLASLLPSARITHVRAIAPSRAEACRPESCTPRPGRSNVLPRPQSAPQPQPPVNTAARPQPPARRRR